MNNSALWNNTNTKEEIEKPKLWELSTRITLDKKQPTSPNRILGGAGYLGGQAGAGAFGVLEGIYDYVVGGIASATGNDDYAKRIMENDISGRWSQNLTDWYQPSKGMQFAGEVASGIGQSAIGIGAAALTGGAAAPVLAGLTIGLGAAGKSTASAFQKTGDLSWREYAYGGASGALEMALETLTGAAGKIGARVASSVSRKAAKTVVTQGIFKTMLSDGAGEFVEEALSTFIDPYLQRGLKIDESAENATIKEITRSGLVGFFSGMVLSGSSMSITNANKARVGDKIMTNGKTESVLNSANTLSAQFADIDSKNKLSKPVQILTESKAKYEGLANKNSLTAKMLLGEMSHMSAVIETTVGIENSKQNVIKYADSVSKALNERGENITADDIKANKNGIADKLAVAEYSGTMIITPEEQSEFMKQSRVNMSKEAFEEWRKEASETEQAEIQSKLGIDIKTASYDEAMATVKAYREIQQTSETAPAIPNGQATGITTAQNENADLRGNTIEQAIADGAVSRTDVRNIKAFANAKNIKVNLYYDKSNTEDGYYKNGEINVNLASSEGAFYTAVHEYMHYLEKTAPKLLTDYLNQVDKLIEMSPRYKKFADEWRELYKSDERTKDISEPDLRNEIAFKITKELIDDPSQFRAIVTKDLTMGQRLLIWFKNLANRLSRNKLTNEAKAVREAVKALQTAISAETTPSENINTFSEKTLVKDEKSKIKYSLDSFDKQVDKVLAGTYPKGEMVLVGKTPKYIAEIGFNNSDLLMDQKHIKDTTTAEDINHPEYHGISIKLLKMMPELLKNPVMVIKSFSRPSDSVVVVLNALDRNKRPVIASIRNDRYGIYNGILIEDANRLSSVYGRNYFESFINRVIREDAIIYANKEKSQKLLNSVGVQFPKVLETFDFNTIIFKYDKKSKSFYKKTLVKDENIKFSLRTKAAPTKTEVAYKVFNQREDGNLYPLYINPDSNSPFVEIGKWYDANEGEYSVDPKNNRKYVKAQGGLSKLAYRPGWHSGSVPYLDHIGVVGNDGKHYLPSNFVWAEVEVPADRDYQAEANNRGTQARDKALDYIPEDGYYKYKTNSNAAADQEWYISGALKVNRILTDADAYKLSGKQTLRNKNITKDIKVSDRNGTVRKLSEDIRYSLTDSQGRTLTKEQQVFFKDSKVRDEQGRLLAVYHGTNADFTIFDSQQKGKNQLSYLGYWFAEDKSVANEFAGKVIEGFFENTIEKTDTSKIMEVYLNLVNPKIYTFEDTTQERQLLKNEYSEIEKKINEIKRNWYYEQYTSDIKKRDEARKHLDEITETLKPRLNELRLIIRTKGENDPLQLLMDDRDLYAEWISGEKGVKGAWRERYVEMGDKREASLKLKQQLIDEGYDGIILDGTAYDSPNNVRAKQYIVFSPNQIKLTTNLNPTESEDIRYSLTEPHTVQGTDTKVLTAMPQSYKVTKREAIRDGALAAQIQFVNAQAGIEAVGKRLGIKNIEELTNSARAGQRKGEEMLGGNQFTLDGKEVGRGLEPILRPIENKGSEYKGAFFEYLLHKHNATGERYALEKYIFGKEVTPEISEKRFKELEKQNPEFVDISAELNKYLQNLRQLMVDSGLISQETADELHKRYPNYVPTFRDVKALIGTGALSGKYNMAVKPTIKTAKGSDLDILPIDIMIAKQTLETTKAAGINRLAVAIYEGAQDTNDFSDIEIRSEEKVNSEDMADIDYAETRPKNNEVTFFYEGKRITMRVSKGVFAGFEAFSPSVELSNPFIKVAQKINNIFKRLVTAYNPAFLLRNAVRDLQDAGMYSRYIKSFPKNYAKAMNEIKSNGALWRQYKGAGGLSSSIFNLDDGFFGAQNKHGLSKAEGNILKKGLQTLENANMFIEQLPRLAEFISSIEAGNTVDKALLDAQDITVNFGRSGTLTKKLNSTLIPFLNPAIQGFSKMIRTVTSARTARQISGLLVKVAIMGIVPQLLNQLMYDDDEDYALLNDRDKENYYLFKIGKKFLKIPKGRVNSLFAGLTMRAGQKSKGETPDWKGYGANLLSQVTPVDSMSRTIFSPFKDLATNTTWYGSAIEGRKFENVEPKKRYDEGTSSIAIAMGKFLNYSPKKIHYLLDQYSGVIGDFILPATTKKAEKDFISGNFTVDPITQNKLSNAFYDALDKANYAKSNNEENAEYQVRYLNKVNSAISDMYKQRREIEGSDLSDKEKTAESKAIQILINEAYKTALQDLPLMTEAFKATAGIKEEYRYVEATRLVYGAERALRDYNKQTYEKAQTLNFGGINYDTFYQAYFTLKDIESDKDRKGEVIAGSKKKKVVKFVNTLRITKQQKAVLILANGYSTDKATKQLVFNYVSRLAIPRADKLALAEECGFTVKNGRIMI